jgi:hypothetical protein
MSDDHDTTEEAAELEVTMIDAARELVEEHGYSLDDLNGILQGTVG